MKQTKIESSGTAQVELIHDDATNGLSAIPDGEVSLIVTSPPYNIGKEYERDRKMSLSEYLEWLTPIATSLVRKLRGDGSICWQTGNFIDGGEVFPLDFFFYEIFRNLGLKLRNRIVWRFNFGLHATKRFSGRYETLLWFTKSDEYTFNLDPVRVPQLYPGKKHASSKGEGRAGRYSGNPKGKNPSDFWTFSAENAFINDPIWDFPNVKANHPEKTIHPCQFPHELVERCILAFTRPGDLVLDPFLGAGTTAIAAAKAGRRVIGIDRDPKYIALARERIAALHNGELRLRPSGIAVRTPAAGESVAKTPDDWKTSV